MKIMLPFYTLFTAGLWAVVNNAEIEHILDIAVVSLEHMKQVAEVNFNGMVRVTKALF